MTASSIQVTAGSGTHARTHTRSYSGTTKHSEYVVLDRSDAATYSTSIDSTSVATANSHPLQLMAGSSLVVYVHSIVLWQFATATTAGMCEWHLRRLTTAGTGGTTLTEDPFDTTDSAAGAAGMKLPSSKGTEGTILNIQTNFFVQTPGTATTALRPVFQWPPPFAPVHLFKPIRIPAGTSNGICVKNISAMTGATVTGSIIYTEEDT